MKTFKRTPYWFLTISALFWIHLGSLSKAEAIPLPVVIASCLAGPQAVPCGLLMAAPLGLIILHSHLKPTMLRENKGRGGNLSDIHYGDGGDIIIEEAEDEDDRNNHPYILSVIGYGSQSNEGVHTYLAVKYFSSESECESMADVLGEKSELGQKFNPSSTRPNLMYKDVLATLAPGLHDLDFHFSLNGISAIESSYDIPSDSNIVTYMGTSPEHGFMQKMSVFETLFNATVFLEKEKIMNDFNINVTHLICDEGVPMSNLPKDQHPF